MKDLKDAFDARSKWHNNRSSTVFPFFPSSDTTHYLVFQDYWSWKSKINTDHIKCNVRFFNSKSGHAIQIREFEISPHNCINLNDQFHISTDGELDSKNEYSFEVELISVSNLGFPFPGLMLFCLD